MRTDLAEFWRIVEEASVVKVDASGQYYLVRHPEHGWRLYQRGIGAAFLLAQGRRPSTGPRSSGCPLWRWRDGVSCARHGPGHRCGYPRGRSGWPASECLEREAEEAWEEEDEVERLLESGELF